MLELSSDDIVSIDRSVDQNAPPAMEGWDDIDPENDIAGHFYDSDGNKHYIRLNDPKSLICILMVYSNSTQILQNRSYRMVLGISKT